jgi:leucyl aminopeptidase (aminopeptidase T)
MRARLAGLLLVALIASRTDAATSAADVHQTDWSAIAKHMVERSLALAPGERVLIAHDPDRDPALVAALRTQITRAGGIVSGEIAWPSADVATYLDTLSPGDKKRRAELENATYRELFAHADVFLWLQVSNAEELAPRQFEHLIAESKVRAIHTHWFEPSDPAERNAVRRMYERAILRDPATLEKRFVPLEARLRGARVRVTSPQGTDLTFQIPSDAWFHHNTGEATRRKVANARSTRDREEELPAGVLRTTDVVGANGTLVALLPTGVRDDLVTLTFREGRVVKVATKGEGAAEFSKWYESVTGDRDRISELVIGVNPDLLPIQPSGFMPYYGYGAGVIRIAIGENWESGGKLRTSDGSEFWLFVTDGTLTVGKTNLIERAQLR